MKSAPPVPNQKKLKVGALGFFESSRKASSQPISKSDYEIIPIKRADYSKALDQFDLVIFQTGLFESFEIKSGFNGRYTEADIKHDSLLHRERELRNLLKKGATICCLVEEVMDRVPAGSYKTSDVSDTDLGKRLMNITGVRRDLVDPNVHLETKASEFGKYVSKFGVGRTRLNPDFKIEHRKLVASSRDVLFGLEINQQVFFLPFHSDRKDDDIVTELLITVTEAVRDYQQKHRLDLPEWLNDIPFKEEKSLVDERKSLESRLAQVNSGVESWKKRKAVLTASGSSLVTVAEEVLNEFFGLKVKNKDVGIEDLCLLGPDGKTIAVAEVKGIKGGVKRDNVTQVELHRSRLELGPDIPGVLIANSQMDVAGLDNRTQSVAPEHIRYATSLNVTILLTTDLIRIMQLWEDDSKEERGKKFLEYISKGGGWLRVKEKILELKTS